MKQLRNVLGTMFQLLSLVYRYTRLMDFFVQPTICLFTSTLVITAAARFSPFVCVITGMTTFAFVSVIRFVSVNVIKHAWLCRIHEKASPTYYNLLYHKSRACLDSFSYLYYSGGKWCIQTAIENEIFISLFQPIYFSYLPLSSVMFTVRS